MDTGSCRLKFYEIVSVFKDEIIKLIGDDSIGLDTQQKSDCKKKLNNVYEKLMLAKSANSKLPIDMFYKHIILQYGIHIVNENDSFFIQNDLTNGVNIESHHVLFINELKSIWNYLDNQNKKIIWRYIKSLMALCDKIYGENVIDQCKTIVNKC